MFSSSVDATLSVLIETMEDAVEVARAQEQKILRELEEMEVNCRPRMK